jgi:hypothetical protein
MKFTDLGYADHSIDVVSLMINVIVQECEDGRLKPEDLPWDYILEIFLTLKDPPTA